MFCRFLNCVQTSKSLTTAVSALVMRGVRVEVEMVRGVPVEMVRGVTVEVARGVTVEVEMMEVLVETEMMGVTM